MRLPNLFIALTTISLVASQDDKPGEKVSTSDLIDPENITTIDLTDSKDAFFTAVASTNLAVSEDENDGAQRVEVNIEISAMQKYQDPLDSYVLLPRNGRALELDEKYDGHFLLNISFSSGPCAMTYEDASGPPPKDNPNGVSIVNRKKTFGKEGGWFSPSQSFLGYIYCGDEAEFQPPGSEAEVCEDTFKGDLARDTLDVCCKMPSQWDPKLWDDHDMDSYLEKSIKHWNDNGWPASVLRTFAEYDQTKFIRADEMEPERPMWQWNCDGIHSDRCQVRDLSYRNACVQDPKRTLLLQALENFAGLWQSERTKYDEQALTDIVMTLPNLTKTLFPLVANDEFDAPGDYNDATWVMIAGGIVGLLAIPFTFGASAAIAGATSGLLGGIMWQIGLALGPVQGHFNEEDPHFSMFGDFSEDVGRNVAKQFYNGYRGVFNSFFMDKPDDNKGVDATSFGDIFRGGSLIRPLSAGQSTESSGKNAAENILLSPIVNLAWQRQKVFLVKFPKGGIEFFRHSDTDPTETLRASVVYDPCGDHDGEFRYRRNFLTSEPNDATDWRDDAWARGRHMCMESGETYMFMAWKDDRHDAFENFGWDEVERRGMLKTDIVNISQHNQKATSGYNEHPKSLEERLTQMTANADSAVDNPGVLDFWNLAVCDLAGANDERKGLIRVESAGFKSITENGRGTRYLDEHDAMNKGIREYCVKQKAENGAEWPYSLEDK